MFSGIIESKGSIKSIEFDQDSARVTINAGGLSMDDVGLVGLVQRVQHLAGDVDGAVMGEGAIAVREKCLMALAVAHAIQCPYCIEAYSKKCLESGSDLEQMTEAVHCAAAINGGAALVHGMQMCEHVHRSMM